MAGGSDDTLQQPRSGPSPAWLGSDGDELAILADDPIRRVPHGSLAVHGHEARQVDRANLLPVRDDEIRVPCVEDVRTQPIRRHGIGRKNLHRPYRISPICPAMFSSARIRSPMGGWVSHSDFARSSNDLIGFTM